jgi:hypothetical protein
MRIDAGISSRSSQVLILPIRNMQVCLWIPVLLCQPKINNIHLIGTFSQTHQEIVGFDVSMDEIFGMNILDAGNLPISLSNGTYQLISQQQNRLERKFSVAEVEQIFQRRPQKINHHAHVLSFDAIPANKGNTNSTRQGFVHLCFVFELWMTGFD